MDVRSEPVAYSLTEQDVVAADKLYRRSYFTEPRNYKGLIILWLVVNGALLVLYFSGLFNARDARDLITVLVPAMTIAIFVIPVTASALTGPIRARQNFRGAKVLQGEFTCSWSSDGFTQRTATGTTVLPWDHIAKWREDQASVILFIAPHHYLLVPKRHLTQAQADDLRAHLARLGTTAAVPG
jgi:YcxB-like protein